MGQGIWGSTETLFFHQLSPEIILKAVDQKGWNSTGRCLQLNSMENRVYEVEVDRPSDQIKSPSDSFVVVKFYRPGRWRLEQIQEEHEFLFDLAEAEVPVLAPFKVDGESVFTEEKTGLFYCIYPKKGGRMADEILPDQIPLLGRLVARLHQVGRSRPAQHRMHLNPQSFGQANLDFLLSSDLIPQTIRHEYAQAAQEVINRSLPLFATLKPQRIHGDCHRGNLLYREGEGFFFIDFDDMVMGPAIQDLWLLIPGVDEESQRDRQQLLEAYDEWSPLPWDQVRLIEALRALRYIHFSSWIARRWQDQAFPRAFPHFGPVSYWEHQVHDLRLQLAQIP